MINELPTVFDTLNGNGNVKTPKDQSGNHNSSKSKSGPKITKDFKSVNRDMSSLVCNNEGEMRNGGLLCGNLLAKWGSSLLKAPPATSRDRLLRPFPCLMPASCFSYYSTETEPLLSTEPIKIMDQRLSLIEHRSAFLEWAINKLVRLRLQS